MDRLPRCCVRMLRQGACQRPSPPPRNSSPETLGARDSAAIPRRFPSCDYTPIWQFWDAFLTGTLQAQGILGRSPRAGKRLSVPGRFFIPLHSIAVAGHPCNHDGRTWQFASQSNAKRCELRHSHSPCIQTPRTGKVADACPAVNPYEYPTVPCFIQMFVSYYDDHHTRSEGTLLCVPPCSLL